MKAIRAALLLLAAIAVAGALSAQAQILNRETKVAFSHAVEVPGRVLPTGTYTFTVPEALGPGNGFLVQVWNHDKTQLMASIMAVKTYRAKPTHETVIKFSDQPSPNPPRINAWFYPGVTYGVQFVYPKTSAAN